MRKLKNYRSIKKPTIENQMVVSHWKTPEGNGELSVLEKEWEKNIAEILVFCRGSSVFYVHSYDSVQTKNESYYMNMWTL